jgi:hypothetical protein
LELRRGNGFARDDEAFAARSESCVVNPYAATTSEIGTTEREKRQKNGRGENIFASPADYFVARPLRPLGKGENQ